MTTNGHKLHLPNGDKIFQMVIKFKSISNSEALPNLRKFFAMKINHLANLQTAWVERIFRFGDINMHLQALHVID
jgi:hypothetical protein